MNIKYENSRGQVIEFDKSDGWFVQFSSDLLSFNHKYEKHAYAQKIKGFTKEIQTRQLTIVLLDPNSQTFRQKMTIFLDIIDYDVVSVCPGKLWIGDFYLKCYFNQNASRTIDDRVNKAVFPITLTTEESLWIKEHEINIPTTNYTIVQPFAREVEFVMTAQLDTTATTHRAEFRSSYWKEQQTYGTTSREGGDFFVIDSEEKDFYTIVDDEIIDLYSIRQTSNNSIFSPLPQGASITVVLTGIESITLTIKERRATLPWSS